MKSILRSASLVFLICVILLHSCQKEDVPSITTIAICNITSSSASGGGIISSEGSEPIIARGLCWDIYPYPTIADSKTNDGTGPGFFESKITGLKNNTTYYVRAYATNINGTTYGINVSFTLWLGYPGPEIIDSEGNDYKTVRIGDQFWMKEDLRTTKFYDGTSIPLVKDAVEWSNLTTPAYSWFLNNEPSSYSRKGALYNAYVVTTGKLCPVGWFVPADEDWKVLEIYLGMSQEQVDTKGYRGTDQGFQIKSESGWPCLSRGACEFSNYFSYGGNNVSGFSAWPNYLRLEMDSPIIYDIMVKNYPFATWWTSSEDSSSFNLWAREVNQGQLIGRVYNNKKRGLSVRCIRY